MPAIQSSYGTMTGARLGQIAEFYHAEVQASRTVEDVAGIGFGLACYQGVADAGVTKTPNAKFVGISIRTQGTNANLADIWGQGDDLRLMTKGVIWVTAGATVVAGDPVYVAAANGAFTNVSTANVLVVGARFDSGAASGALVKVRLG